MVANTRSLKPEVASARDNGRATEKFCHEHEPMVPGPTVNPGPTLYEIEREIGMTGSPVKWLFEGRCRKRLLVLLLFVSVLLLFMPHFMRAQEPIRNPAWATACRALGPNQTQCSLFHRQLLESGEILLTLELVGLEENQSPSLIVSTPLGSHLQSKVNIQFGSGDLYELEFVRCLQGGCKARLDGEEILNLMRLTQEMRVQYEIFQGGSEVAVPIELVAPLAGFSEALDAIRLP